MDVVGKSGAGSLSAQRRRALLEFELMRSPSQPDYVIAKHASCPTARVAPVRAELLAAGRLPSASAG